MSQRAYSRAELRERIERRLKAGWTGTIVLYCGDGEVNRIDYTDTERPEGSRTNRWPEVEPANRNGS